MSTPRTASHRSTSIARTLALTLALAAPLGLAACGGSSADDATSVKAVATAFTKAFVAEDTGTICSNGVGWKEAAAEEGAPDVSCDALIKLSLKQQDGDSLTSVFAVDPDELSTLRAKITGDRAVVATEDGQESMPLVRSDGSWKVDVRRKVDPTDAERTADDPKALVSGADAARPVAAGPLTSASETTASKVSPAATSSQGPGGRSAASRTDRADTPVEAAVRAAVGRYLSAVRAADPAKICGTITGETKLRNGAIPCRRGFGKNAATASAQIPEVTPELLDASEVTVDGSTALFADRVGDGKLLLRKVAGTWKVDVAATARAAG